MIDYLKFGQRWLAYYAIQEKDWSNSGEYGLHSLKAFKFIESVYILHINILRYMDLLPRYHLVGYSGTVLHLTIRYRAHIPPAGYTLYRALTIREVAAP